MTQQDRTATHARWQSYKPVVLEVAPNLFVVDTPTIDPLVLARTCAIGKSVTVEHEASDEDCNFYPLRMAGHHDATSYTRVVLTIEQVEALHASLARAVGPNVTFDRISPITHTYPEEVSSDGR